MRTAFKIVSIFVIVSYMVSSCSKDQLEIPEENEPVFTVSGTFGDNPLSLTAGDNGAYMYTNTSIINGVNLYGGYISDGATTIELGVFDGSIDIPNHIPEIEIANLSPLFAQFQYQPMAELNKYAFSNQSYIAEIEWFANGQLIGINEADINEPGKYEICAHITYLDLTSDTLCNELILGYQRSGNFQINHSAASGYLNADISLIGGIGTPTEIKWYLDGAYLTNLNILQTSVGNGSHLLTAEVTFANGVKRVKNCLVNAVNQAKNIEDFTVFELQNNGSYKQDYRLVLKITKDGQEYVSDHADNDNSTVEITDVSYFGKNAAGKDVYKVVANISANVKAIGTMKHIPVTLSTAFGIEIP